MKVFILCLAVVVVAGGSLHKNEETCDYLDCRAGRECVIDDGVAQCLCIISCPDHLKPVCGSDGKSYDSHCFLHQHACVTGTHISIEHKGFCKNNKKKNKMILKDEENSVLSRSDLEMKLKNDLIADIKSGAQVTDTPDSLNSKKTMAACFSSQREAMRYLLVGYWAENAENQPWYKAKMTNREKLWGFFYTCDTSNDNNLTPLELLDCAGTVDFYPRPGQNKMETKALCIEALIEDADQDKDLKIDFNEFTRVMNSHYQPKEKTCSLQGNTYTDGQEVDELCNHCVCAIGKWICSPSNCKPKKEKHQNHIFQDGDFDNNVYEDFTDDHIKSVDITHKKADDLGFDTGLNTNFDEDLQNSLTKEDDYEFDFETGVNTNFDQDFDLAKDKMAVTDDDLGIDDYDYNEIEDKSIHKKNNKKYRYKLEQALKKVQQLEQEAKETEELLKNTLEEDKQEKKQMSPKYSDSYSRKMKLQKFNHKESKISNKEYKQTSKHTPFSKKKTMKGKLDEEETPWMELLHFKDYDSSKYRKTSDIDNDI